jgi:hypothetical protein
MEYAYGQDGSEAGNSRTIWTETALGLYLQLGYCGSPLWGRAKELIDKLKGYHLNS